MPLVEEKTLIFRRGSGFVGLYHQLALPLLLSSWHRKGVCLCLLYLPLIFPSERIQLTLHRALSGLRRLVVYLVCGLSYVRSVAVCTTDLWSI